LPWSTLLGAPGGIWILSAVPLYRDFDGNVWLLHGKGR
jgi:hypothetical protein